MKHENCNEVQTTGWLYCFSSDHAQNLEFCTEQEGGGLKSKQNKQ